MFIEAYLTVLNVLKRVRFQLPEDGDITAPDACWTYGKDNAREL
jgi:hypothetical protein